jgi:hypothetical protein
MAQPHGRLLYSSVMTPEHAVERLLEVLPEFRRDYEESDGCPTEPGTICRSMS